MLFEINQQLRYELPDRIYRRASIINKRKSSVWIRQSSILNLSAEENRMEKI